MYTLYYNFVFQKYLNKTDIKNHLICWLLIICEYCIPFWESDKMLWTFQKYNFSLFKQKYWKYFLDVRQINFFFLNIIPHIFDTTVQLLKLHTWGAFLMQEPSGPNGLN